MLSIDQSIIAGSNDSEARNMSRDFGHLGEQLARRGIDAEEIVNAARALEIGIPTWGVGTGGTRFARFPIAGEPQTIFDKIQDCAVIQQLVRCTPMISPHFPWDYVDDFVALKTTAAELGLRFAAVNSNTFQNLPGQKHSYKFGSLSHTEKAVRDQAVKHNIECIEAGKALGSDAITVWIADGSNFAGQQHFTRALERYLHSMAQIYDALPDDWSMYIEHKLYEPAFYSTVMADWGTSFACASQLGPKALCLVDLGHHAPTTNIEMLVARLIQFGKLAGFHFNDSRYGDDDLDSGSINPFRLFLVFNELVDAAHLGKMQRVPEYMMDQSHNVTDPIESLLCSAIEIQRAYVQALIIDREALYGHQDANDALMAFNTLKSAYTTDVSPILAEARWRSGGAIDPIAVYRESGYRDRAAKERKQELTSAPGIV